jgi:hypothetical protein
MQTHSIVDRSERIFADDVGQGDFELKDLLCGDQAFLRRDGCRETVRRACPHVWTTPPSLGVSRMRRRGSSQPRGAAGSIARGTRCRRGAHRQAGKTKRGSQCWPVAKPGGVPMSLLG